MARKAAARAHPVAGLSRPAGRMRRYRLRLVRRSMSRCTSVPSGLRPPGGDERIADRHACRGEQPGCVDDVEAPPGGLVSHRGAELHNRIAGEEPRGVGVGRTSRPVRRVLWPGHLAALPRSATIPLGLPSPAGSSGPPAGSGGPPSNACAGRSLSRPTLSTLLRVGFTEPPGSPRALVVSYTTVSPLPPRRTATAVCFLWHCPAGHPGLPLATTLPCGARTFLGRGLPRTRSPGRLVRRTPMVRRRDTSPGADRLARIA